MPPSFVEHQPGPPPNVLFRECHHHPPMSAEDPNHRNCFSNSSSSSSSSTASSRSSNSACSDSQPRVVHDEEQHQHQQPRVIMQVPVTTATSGGTKALGMMSRTKSLYSMTSSTASSLSSSLASVEEAAATALQHKDEAVPEDALAEFARDAQSFLQAKNSNNNEQGLVFDSEFRRVLEPHLRRARLQRETVRESHRSSSASNNGQTFFHRSIADSVGVPYTALRHERAFLFDEYTYPLHHCLAQALQVNDLLQLHLKSRCGVDDHQHVLSPLLNDEQRIPFHDAYDNFVTTFCIPLLHSLAMSKKVFDSTVSSDQITYRYQAFPTIRVVQPGDGPHIAPTCDTIQGHSVGCLHFCIPLTPASCLNDAVMFVESHPGREDWHKVHAKSFGLGHLLDGARCLYFDLGNPIESNTTRVSLHFTILLYRDYYGQHITRDAAGLCPVDIVEDALTHKDANFYDEAVLNMNQEQQHQHHQSSSPHFPLRHDDIVRKKYGKRLLRPSPLLGPPFSR